MLILLALVKVAGAAVAFVLPRLRCSRGVEVT